MSNCPLKEAAREAPQWAALDRLAEECTNALRTQGIREGDRIALCRFPPEQWIAWAFATWRLKASFCPLNTRLPAAQIEMALTRLKPKLFLDTMQSFPSAPSHTSSIFLFTSGSTGTPKIAILSLQNLIANATSALRAVDFRPGDRWLLSLPLYHVGGIGIVLRTILGRGHLAFDSKDLAVTHLSHVPTQLYRAWPVYPRLRCLLLGGGPMGAIPSQLPILPSYGLTEMGSLVAAGKELAVLPGREVRLAEDGEIWVRGTCRFHGYWGEKAPFDEEGWFPTGDLGRWEKGLQVGGRKDWMFISGGENIQPEEIERYLFEIPGVLEAVVFPLPDPEFGMRPVAVLQTIDGSFDVRSARAFLLEHLPKYKIPIAFHIAREIPKQGLKMDRKIIFEFFLPYFQSVASKSGQKNGADL